MSKYDIVQDYRYSALRRIAREWNMYSPQNGKSPCHFPRGLHTKLPVLKKIIGLEWISSGYYIANRDGYRSLFLRYAIDNNPPRYAVENSCRTVGAKNVTYDFLHIIDVIMHSGKEEARALQAAIRALVLAPKRIREKLDKKVAFRLKELCKDNFGFLYDF